jgi:D-alanyl-D-alanine carboxypeptidase
VGEHRLRRNRPGDDRAQAEALLVIDAESGKVLYAHNAGYPWYPASVTKLMTAYVTLRAVNEGRLTLTRRSWFRRTRRHSRR